MGRSHDYVTGDYRRGNYGDKTYNVIVRGVDMTDVVDIDKYKKQKADDKAATTMAEQVKEGLQNPEYMQIHFVDLVTLDDLTRLIEQLTERGKPDDTPPTSK